MLAVNTRTCHYTYYSARTEKLCSALYYGWLNALFSQIVHLFRRHERSAASTMKIEASALKLFHRLVIVNWPLFTFISIFC